MKLSVDDMSGDDYEKRELCKRAKIMLDGVQMEACILADEEAGHVDVLLDQSDPRFTSEVRKDPTKWPHERRYGKVEIVDPLVDQSS